MLYKFMKFEVTTTGYLEVLRFPVLCDEVPAVEQSVNLIKRARDF